VILTIFAPFWEPDVQRLGKSIEFPAIEAQSKLYSELLASATQDILLEEDQKTDHVQISVTHPEEYTGIVAVHVERIYGTNRTLEAVQADFAKFFATKSGWAALPYGDINTGWMTVAPYGAACVRLKRAERTDLPSWLITVEPTPFPGNWAKYQTLYEVDLDYLDLSKPYARCNFG
jgi:hypothetical protein